MKLFNFPFYGDDKPERTTVHTCHASRPDTPNTGLSFIPMLQWSHLTMKASPMQAATSAYLQLRHPNPTKTVE